MALSDLAGMVGGTELFVLVTTIGILAAVGVYVDGRRHGVSNAALWAASVGFLFLFYALPGFAALIVYFAIRGSRTDGDAEVDHRLTSNEHE